MPTPGMDPAASGRPLEIVLLQERSAGTFARVYLAEARSPDGLNRIVAVKILKEQWSEAREVHERTRDEARLLARLHHKNILRVEAIAELNGQPALVMEFVDGLDLKQLIERLSSASQRIPARAAFKIALDAANALDAAYARVPLGMNEALHVIHRDVKPSNIMVSSEGEVKVLDFGTARAGWEGRQAKTGALRFGSLKYMSPERREGERGDHSGDVYALGLVLVEMLQGKELTLLPLDERAHDEAVIALVAHLDGLGLPNRDWDDSFREMIAAMCASAAERRPTADQVAQLLRTFGEQATGATLDSFAADVVAPLAREVHGTAQSAAGTLAGARTFTVLTSSLDDAPESVPAATPAASMPIVREGASPARALPLQASAGRTRGGNAILVAVAAIAAVLVAGIGLVVVAAAVAVVILLRAGDPTGDTSAADVEEVAEVEEESVTGAGPEEAAQVSVEVDSADPTVQWIRVTDEAGNRRVDGRPAGSGAVMPGTYRIEAKVVGRPAAGASVKVSGPIALGCNPDRADRVVCRDAAGHRIAILQP